MESRRETIQAVEDRLLDFFHHSPGAFRKNLALQMAGQVAAVLGVYLVLRLMGRRPVCAPPSRLKGSPSWST